MGGYQNEEIIVYSVRMKRVPLYIVTLLLIQSCLAHLTQGVRAPVATLTVTVAQSPDLNAVDATSTDISLPSNLEPMLSGCPLFPADNFWNTRIDDLPVHPQSEAWIDSIGRNEEFHMDFGFGEWDGGPIGIPYNIVSGDTLEKFTLDFFYPDESDAGPYPIPPDPMIEYGSDHHILIVDVDSCELYEIYDASLEAGQWRGGSGAIWDLNANALRPAGWTSADAAGLPIFPGLVRYDELASGQINHALRFTAENTNGFIWPARHLTSDDDAPSIPPWARASA